MKDLYHLNILEQLDMVKHFPPFLPKEDGDHIGDPMTLAKVERELKLTAKDKSPRLDQWPIKIFFSFF